MAKKKAQKKLSKQLKGARAEHQKLLKRVDKAKAKFEKRAQKLSALELEISQLEQRYYEPGAERLGQADADKDGARSAALIYHPGSGENTDTAKQLSEIVQALRAYGIAAQVDVKTSGRSARDLAREAVEKEQDLVIVAGGDDTVEEVARELVGTDTTLGIIPLGTNNNLARALGIPLHLEPACALIGMGMIRLLDAGKVSDGQGQSEYFLESAGVGLSQAAEQDHDQDRSRGLPQALRRFDVQPGRLEVELSTGETISPQGHIITVSNAPLLGHNSPVTPDARMDDGLLDVAVYDGLNEQQALDYINRPANAPANDAVQFYRARRVRIESEGRARGRPPAEEGAQELEITLVPHGLAAIVGNGPALSLPVQAVPPDVAEARAGTPNGENGGKARPQVSILETTPNDRDKKT